MELYLIRHGQSLNNIYHDQPECWIPDPELSEHGHEQARLLATHLTESISHENIVLMPADAAIRAEGAPHRLTHLYVSPMLRALQTAQPIAHAFNLTPQVWIDIHEHGGIVEENTKIGQPGLTRAQMAERFPTYALPDGVTDKGWYFGAGQEDLPACNGRAARVAHALRERARTPNSQHDAVALVSHGTFLDSLMKALMDRLPSDNFYHWFYNTSVTRFDLRPDSITLLRYVNRVEHLPARLVT